MKFAFSSLIVFVFISCKVFIKPEEMNYTGFVQKEISLVGFDKQVNLTDSLGFVSIMIPARLDTFYQWHRTSDCLICGRIQYRFSDRNYPQFAESGFYWNVKPDSVYQLTIKHTPIKQIPDSIILRPLTINDKENVFYHQAVSLSIDDSVNYIFKEFREINNRSFILSAFTTSYSYLTKSKSLFVVAATNLKDRELFFIGECGAKDTTGFIDKMYKSFLSIRIKENP